MPLRVQAVDPNYDQRKHAAELAADLRGDRPDSLFGALRDPRFEDALTPGAAPPTSRDENGYRLARMWTQEQGIPLDAREEKRLELAFARVEARERAGWEKADRPDSLTLEPLDLSSVDYARLMIVDASLQRTAAEALEMDVLDREMSLSWINPELAEQTWFRAGISPTEIGTMPVSRLEELASGYFDELSPDAREGLELMLLRGGSMRDEALDVELLRLNEKAYLHNIREYEFGPGADVSKLHERCVMMDLDRFMPSMNRGGLKPHELGGLVERLEYARHHDPHRPRAEGPSDGPVNPQLSINQDEKAFAARVVSDVMNGSIQSKIGSAAKVALEYQQERGVPLDRAAFKRMEVAVARLVTNDRDKRMTDEGRVTALLVDTSIQAQASDKLRRAIITGAPDRSTPSEKILTDLVGKGSVPTFNHSAAERADLESAAAGRFEDISDDRGMASSVRIAFHRVARPMGGEVGDRLKDLIRDNAVGKPADRTWIETNASRLEGEAALRKLSQGPAGHEAPLQRAAGMGR